MIQGLRTAIYPVDDLSRAKAWYAEAFGKAPYYDEAPYVGFNIEGFELGLIAVGPAGTGGAGVVAYWGVEDIEDEITRLTDLGATEHTPVQDVGDGVLVATVLDPFGNPLGLIRNPHFPNTQ